MVDGFGFKLISFVLSLRVLGFIGLCSESSASEVLALWGGRVFEIGAARFGLSQFILPVSVRRGHS